MRFLSIVSRLGNCFKSGFVRVYGLGFMVQRLAFALQTATHTHTHTHTHRNRDGPSSRNEGPEFRDYVLKSTRKRGRGRPSEYEQEEESTPHQRALTWSKLWRKAFKGLGPLQVHRLCCCSKQVCQCRYVYAYILACVHLDILAFLHTYILTYITLN